MDDTIKVLAFDVDGTLTKPTMWARLHEAYGLPQELEDLWRQQYHDKEIGYVEWMNRLSAYWLQHPKTKDEMETIHKTVEFQPHVEEVIHELGKKYPLALISSSQKGYVEIVAKRLSINRIFAFSYDAYDERGVFSGMGFVNDGTEERHKVDSIKELQKEFSCEPHHVAFVGDSRNDLEAFTYTGRGVLIGEGNEEMRHVAWKQISSLDELLTFL